MASVVTYSISDALGGLLQIDGLNALESGVDNSDCGNKQSYLSANLAVVMRDPETRRSLKSLTTKNDC